MGFLGVPVYNLAFLHGLKTVPTGTASLIIALNPVFTAVLARIVLKEPFGLRRTLGLALSLAGVFVVIRYGTDKPVDWPYLSSALVLSLAPLGWAFYTVIGRRLPAAADALDTTYALLFVGSLPLLVLATPSLGRNLLAHPGALGSALYLAVPCTLVAYAGWIWALKRLPAGEVAAFVFLNPPLANLWAWLFEGARLEPPSCSARASCWPASRSSSCRCRSSAARAPRRPPRERRGVARERCRARASCPPWHTDGAWPPRAWRSRSTGRWPTSSWIGPRRETLSTRRWCASCTTRSRRSRRGTTSV